MHKLKSINYYDIYLTFNQIQMIVLSDPTYSILDEELN